jgi:hypothetical protein
MQWREVRRTAGDQAGNTGSIGRDGGGGGVRRGGAGLNERVVRRDAQGRASGAGSIDRAGCGGHTWLSWSVGPLGPGDGPLIHHPR